MDEKQGYEGLTWRDFKHFVDAKLRELNIDESPRISIIDVTLPLKTDLERGRIKVEVGRIGLRVRRL